jgi:Family of unknown function (DUF6152)
MTFRALGFAGIAVAMTAIPAIAHHSFAMFDAEKTKVLEGTIKEFQWTNPHSWILMTVNNDQGQAEQWAIEMGGPAGLARQGWVPKTLTAGMKVKTVIHPLRDGNNGSGRKSDGESERRAERQCGRWPSQSVSLRPRISR